ncbi:MULTISPECIES: helix-turn-helix domain-containing protein [unclassified Mycobacterium]|uniref:PucR family transcriptional regulator n=1 Tax=unclassified Mycobacterium TaxID=2642494 RepID=UPI000991E330|nr:MULTISPECIES: helix-turn-helix domain-containing protein [unclassified Mycobacterium]
MDDEDRARQQFADLLGRIEPRLDAIAADLTRHYRETIPVYDQVDQNAIRTCTRDTLAFIVASRRGLDQVATLRELTELARRWADEEIPLDLVAHTLQVAGRRVFTLVRQEAVAAGISADDIDAMQDYAWQLSTDYAAAVHAVGQERALAGAARRADFVRRLVGGALSRPALEAEAKFHRVDLSAKYHVACANWDDTASTSDLVAGLRRGATATMPVIDAVVDGKIVALLPHRPRLRVAQLVGISPPVLAHEASSGYQLAMEALEVATRYGRRGLVDLSDLGPLSLLEQGQGAAEQLDARHLEPVRALGRPGAEILTTVAAYLAHDQKAEETAKSLFVHRNTIRYRLTRFADLSGLNIDHTGDFVLAWWLLNRQQHS